MKSAVPIQQEKKLLVTFRLEPGCLGPEGADHIAAFCQFAQVEFRSDSEFLVYNIIERTDKSLPEIQYSVLGKVITEQQAQKYLSLFNEQLDDLEVSLSEQLTTLIHRYRNL